MGMPLRAFRRYSLGTIAAIAVAFASVASLRAQPASASPQSITTGQKIVMATHSFNVFIGPNRRVEGDRGPLAKLAAEAGKEGHDTLAVQMIGGSTPMQHWNQGDGDDTKNIAKVVLKKGAVDVFTMSPNARMPDEGIDLFADLGARELLLQQIAWNVVVAEPMSGVTGQPVPLTLATAVHP